MLAKYKVTYSVPFNGHGGSQHIQLTDDPVACEQVLSEITDPIRIEAEFEKSFAEDEWYRNLYRTSYAYNGVHPFYMWYWCSHAMQHLGQVIVVGGDVRAVRRLGFKPASTLQDALEMASDVVGRDASITHLHNPPILMADVS